MKKKIILVSIFIIAFLLRFYQFGINPPSLYWDEASLGYNAYTIATTGRDEHGEFLPLSRFTAFGDYKPPGYIYAAVLPIILGGLNEITVRFPSFLAGIMMIVFTFLLSKEFFKSEKIALLASFIMGISPWGIHFSRVAFEAHLAALLNLMGVYYFVISFKKKPLILFSFICLILSFYTFNANRIIAPLMLIALFLIYLRNSLSNKKWISISIVFGLIMILPTINYLSSPESKIRFQEVSIFNNLEPLKVSNSLIEDDGNTYLVKLIHNRRIIYAIDFLKHYTYHFSLRFLFTHGDVNPRLAIQEMGQLYVFELPFLLFGFYMMIRTRQKAILPILAWMLIIPIPAGMAKETPHALRIISILPTYQIVIAFGLYHFVSCLKSKINLKPTAILFTVICFMFSVSIFYYLHNYYSHFPSRWSGEWQFGYKEMVNFVFSKMDLYDQIYVTNALGRPYVYFAFYKPYGLNELLKLRSAQRDWFGFWEIKRLGKINFDLSLLPQSQGKVLLVTTDKNLSSGFRLIKVIKNLNEDGVFYIGERI